MRRRLTVCYEGLPYPDNLKLAHKLDEIVRSHGAIPATVGMLKGQWWVGMSLSQIEELVESPMPRKLSTRDLALMAGQVMYTTPLGGDTCRLQQ